MIQKRNRLAIALVIIALISACSMIGVKPMTPKQQATVWMEIYNFQYDDTMATMTNPLSTEEQKTIGRIKKDILIKVWPMLKAYAEIVDAGGVPSEEMTLKIAQLMNQLVNMGGKH